MRVNQPLAAIVADAKRLPQLAAAERPDLHGVREALAAIGRTATGRRR